MVDTNNGARPGPPGSRDGSGQRQSGTPRANASEKRWEDIVLAATELFATQGYDGTSLKEIADSVGLLKGSVYYYIESKEDLLYEVTRRSLERHSGTIVESPELAGAPAPKRLYEFIRRWMAAADMSANSGLVAEREFRKLDARRLRSIMTMRREYEDFLRGILNQGLEEGTLDADLDVSIAVNTIFPMSRNTHNWFSAKGSWSYDQVINWTAATLVRGLGGDEALRIALAESE